jgi:hypothetical protein
MTPEVFYTYLCNHARRLRLEKLLYLELSRSPSEHFKPLPDPGTVAVSEAKWPLCKRFRSETFTNLYCKSYRL